MIVAHVPDQPWAVQTHSLAKPSLLGRHHIDINFHATHRGGLLWHGLGFYTTHDGGKGNLHHRAVDSAVAQDRTVGVRSRFDSTSQVIFKHNLMDDIASCMRSDGLE